MTNRGKRADSGILDDYTDHSRKEMLEIIIPLLDIPEEDKKKILEELNESKGDS